jgi:transposase
MFSYLSPEKRVPKDHPLRRIREMVDGALAEVSPRFEVLYAKTGRPSIAPERLLRALLLQVLYTVRSERQLMEQLDYNLLFRWFVGLNADDPVWDATVFTKNRDRLLAGDVAQAFFEAVLSQAKAKRLLSTEHFTVDGTLIEAWASQKSLVRRGEP